LFPTNTVKVSTAEQMRELDRRAIEEFGVPSIVLMENAGRSVYAAACGMLGSVSYRKIVVVSGRGNNGGDGFVAARHLRDAGADVSVFVFGEIDSVKGDARINLEILRKTGIAVRSLSSVSDLESSLHSADLVIDALFGTGLKGEITGLSAEIIRAINSENSPVLSVDIPSGLDADSGQALGVCVDADSTVTFALPKLGLLTYPGASFAGQLIISEIGIPQQLYEEINVSAPGSDWVSAHLPKRPLNAHKGTFGTLVVIAGSSGLTGAAVMSAQAGLRTGVGLCTLGIPVGLQDVVASKVTEVMTYGLPQTENRSFSPDAVGPSVALCEKSSAVVLGCGLSHHPSTSEFVHEFVKTLDKRLLVDADGLNCLADDVSVLEGDHTEMVITPHPGEMARLLGTTTEDIQSNRMEAVRAAAARFHCVAVLKGANTLIADQSGSVYINRTGNSGLATAGTGDVLSGIIGSLLAQGMDAFEAAVCGVFVHGVSGDIVADRLGTRGMNACDVLDAIPEALKDLSD